MWIAHIRVHVGSWCNKKLKNLVYKMYWQINYVLKTACFYSLLHINKMHYVTAKTKINKQKKNHTEHKPLTFESGGYDMMQWDEGLLHLTVLIILNFSSSHFLFNLCYVFYILIHTFNLLLLSNINNKYWYYHFYNMMKNWKTK